MKIFPLFLAVLSCALTVHAQPPVETGEHGSPPPPPEEGWEQPMSPPDEGPGGHPPPIQILLQQWKERNPDEFKRMNQLREEDPDAFRRELNRKVNRAREEKGLNRYAPEGRGPRGGPPGEHGRPDPKVTALEKEIHGLSQAWQAARSEEEKASIKSDLQAALGQAFDLKEQARRERLADMEKKIEQLRATLEQRQQQRNAIVEKRLLELTEGDRLAW